MNHMHEILKTIKNTYILIRELTDTFIITQENDAESYLRYIAVKQKLLDTADELFSTLSHHNPDWKVTIHKNEESTTLCSDIIGLIELESDAHSQIVESAYKTSKALADEIIKTTQSSVAARSYMRHSG